MTVVDIFKVVVFFSAIAGLLLMTVSYVAITGLTMVQNVTANIPTFTPASLINNSVAIAQFMPTLSIIMIIILILFSWILSAFIKASPLGAVISVAWLIFYTIASFFISHYLIQAARIPIFISLGASANFVFLFWANMPVILVFATIIDIAIAMLALSR